MISTEQKPSILDIPLKRWFPANVETLLVILLLMAAVVSRFYNLGAMTITFDEVNHVTPSNSLYSGKGYDYDPMSHGPLQYHMISLSYALFGDTDFTTRIPAALCSIASIAIALFLFKCYLGRKGALVAGLLFLISPFMLFYGRYARNEAYIVVWGLLTLYTMLRYLERGEAWVLLLFTLVNGIHFTDKTTSFMYAGEEFLFMLVYFIDRLSRREWTEPRRRRNFFLGLIIGIVCLGAGGAVYLFQKSLPPATTKIVLEAVAGVLGLIGAAALVGRLVMGGASDRIGRRPTFAIFFLAAMASTIVAFFFMNSAADVFWMVPLTGFFQLSVFGGYAIYFPELFPTRLRSTGTSLCYNIARFVAATGPLGLGLLTSKVFAGYEEPMRYAGVTMSAVFLLGIVVLPFAPETKGQPLPE